MAYGAYGYKPIRRIIKNRRMKNLKCIITYEHVLGATLAKGYLLAKGLDVQMDELPKETGAKLWIEEDKVEHARKLLEESGLEIKKK